MASSDDSKLSLVDACGMAIGGMVGGGIFAVLGEAVLVAGNATFISLGIGGLLALITGVVYSKLTVAFDEPGGSFVFIEHVTGPRFAGTVSWFLIFGYVLTVSLYAYTFGAYAGRLLGLESGPHFWLGSGIVVFITVLNLLGVRESGVSEDLMVYTKIAILTGLIAVGFFTVEAGKILPIANKGPDSIFFGAALVFVAYEGFQLLTYDYGDMADHRTNLPRAVWISIGTVIMIYMLIAFVLTGSLGPEVIRQHRETALAILAQPVLGRTGLIVVLVAAVFSTASAILATMFALARLGRRVAEDGQLPHQLTDRLSGGVPVAFIVLVGAVSILVQLAGDLHQITTFSSLVFLVVFSVVNFIGYHYRIMSNWKRWIPLAGSLGCGGAAIVLLYDTWITNPGTVWRIAAIFAVITLLRLAYTFWHSHYKGRHPES